MPRLEARFLRKPVVIHESRVNEAVDIMVDGRGYPMVRRELGVGITHDVTPPFLDQRDSVFKVIVPPSSEGVLFTYKRSDRERSAHVIVKLSERTQIAYFQEVLDRNMVVIYGAIIYIGESKAQSA